MPKKIFLIRHAKSSWTDFSISDFDRPLDDRGVRDAPIMAQFLKDRGVTPHKIISSSAMRAKTTAQFFDKVFSMGVSYVDALYHCQPDEFINVLETVDESTNCVMLFAHNPGITFAANLVKMGCTDNVSTCGVVELEMNSKILWKDIDWNKMTLLQIHTPRGIGL